MNLTKMTRNLTMKTNEKFYLVIQKYDVDQVKDLMEFLIEKYSLPIDVEVWRKK